MDLRGLRDLFFLVGCCHHPVTVEGLGCCLGAKVCSRKDRPTPTPGQLLAQKVSGGFPIACPSLSPPIVPSCSQVCRKIYPPFFSQLPIARCAGACLGGA